MTNTAAGVSSGIPNIKDTRARQKKNYKYIPPYGYGGNLSFQAPVEKLDRSVSQQQSQNQYYNFMDQISLPIRDPSNEAYRAQNSRDRANRSMIEKYTPDPNLSIKPISKYVAQGTASGGKRQNIDPLEA